jgi:dTDP-4-amino-4,6-dideoxygalactose transaminase
MDWKVPLADLDYGIEEEQAVLSVLRSKWLTMGAVTQEFEARFKDLVGSRYALAVSNATQALHLACLALGIGPGDEVIVPSLTFVATANAVLYTGAEVRFADILSPLEPTLDPAEIDRLATPRTKAVIVMHYGGYPCRMDEILAACRRRSLRVIEDAAHSPGAVLAGKPLGAWGDIGCFSFFSNKNLSTGEGGMLTTSALALYEKMKTQRSHGMTTLTYDRHRGHAFSYDVVDLGYNDRIDEMRAALGLCQLAKLPANNARRWNLTCQYWDALKSAGVATLGYEAPFAHLRRQVESGALLPACHLLPILLPQGMQPRFPGKGVPGEATAGAPTAASAREAFMTRLKERGVQSSIHYPPIHQFSYYRARYGGELASQPLPKTEDYAAREVTLPLYPSMGEDRVDWVLKTMKF